MTYLDFFVYVALILPALLTGFFTVVVFSGILGWLLPTKKKEEE